MIHEYEDRLRKPLKGKKKNRKSIKDPEKPRRREAKCSNPDNESPRNREKLKKKIMRGEKNDRDTFSLNEKEKGINEEMQEKPHAWIY